MPAIRNPAISTNGTAIMVSFAALGASTVDAAKRKAIAPAMTRHAVVGGRGGLGRGERTDQSADYRLREGGECVDGGDGDRARADEADLGAPDRRRVRGKRDTGRCGLHRCENWN